MKNLTKISCHHLTVHSRSLDADRSTNNRSRRPRSFSALASSKLSVPQIVIGIIAHNLREKAIKIGSRAVQHAKYAMFQLAEPAIKRDLFQAILTRIGRLQRLSRAA